MSLFSVGRLCVKVAGRDAGRKCVVVESVDGRFVVVDGNVRRKKVNVRHLEPLDQTVKISEKASHADVKKEFDSLGIPTWEKKSKKVAERPKRVKKKKSAKVEKPKKQAKKAQEKLVEKKVETAKEAAPAAETKVESPKEKKVTESKDSESSAEPAVTESKPEASEKTE